MKPNGVAKDVWSAICAAYDIEPQGQVTPIFWIEDAIQYARNGKIDTPIPPHVERVDLVTGEKNVLSKWKT